MVIPLSSYNPPGDCGTSRLAQANLLLHRRCAHIVQCQTPIIRHRELGRTSVCSARRGVSCARSTVVPTVVFQPRHLNTDLFYAPTWRSDACGFARPVFERMGQAPSAPGVRPCHKRRVSQCQPEFPSGADLSTW